MRNRDYFGNEISKKLTNSITLYSCDLIYWSMTVELFFDGDDMDQVQLCFCDKVYTVPRYILLLHSSRLCDLIRSKHVKTKDKLKVNINRECKYFQAILDYLYTGYVNLPNEMEDIYGLIMEIAYFNLSDMAERVKYLIDLKDNYPNDFGRNQIRSVTSSVSPHSRLTLTVGSPIIYVNPAPVPIAYSDKAGPHAHFLLRLQCLCNHETFAWVVCSSTRQEMKDAEIRELGDKYVVLGDVPTPVTVGLTEIVYTTVFCHILCEDISGTTTSVHAEIPFVLSIFPVVRQQTADTRAVAMETSERLVATDTSYRSVVQPMGQQLSSVTTKVMDAEVAKVAVPLIPFTDTVCSKSDIVTLLDQWKTLPKMMFATKTVTAEGIGKETAESLITAISKGAFPKLQELNIADNDMGTAVTAELASSLQRGVCPDLRSLILHDNRIGSTVGALFAGVVKQHLAAVLESLDVKHNRLKTDGLMALLEMAADQPMLALRSLLLSDNEESQAVVSRLLELIAEGRMPALEQVEWSKTLSQTLSLPFDLLRRVQSQSPKLTLPLASITFPEVSPSQITDVFNFISAGLLANLKSLQWSQGPSSLTVTSDLIISLRALDRKADSMRLPQIRALDLSDLGQTDLIIILRCIIAGMFSSLQSIVLSKNNTVVVDDEILLLINQYVHSGFYSSSIKMKETTIKGVGVTNKGVESLIVILQVGLFSDVTEIDLRNNFIHDDSVCLLSECLQLHEGSIVIKLIGNPIVKPDTWYTVAKMLFKVTSPDAGLKSFADSLVDVVLEAVYRQRRSLILEDLDMVTLGHLCQVLKSGALSCVRSLSLSQNSMDDEAPVVDLIGCFDDRVCVDLRQLSLVFTGLNCGIGDQSIMRLAEVVQNGCLPALELLNLSDCYINKSSDTLLIKALKSGSKRMKKLGIKTKRSSMTPSCMNLLQSQQSKKSMRTRSRSPSR